MTLQTLDSLKQWCLTKENEIQCLNQQLDAKNKELEKDTEIKELKKLLESFNVISKKRDYQNGKIQYYTYVEMVNKGLLRKYLMKYLNWNHIRYFVKPLIALVALNVEDYLIQVNYIKQMISY